MQAVTPVPVLMSGILNPAAEVVWDSAGWVITADGETSLFPKAADEWAAVEVNALLVAEVGNLLQIPERSQGRAWDAWGVALTQTALRVHAAAEARDEAALFDAGGAVYQACRGCHLQYWTDGSSPHAVPLP